MKHLKELLIRLQTFDLKMVNRKVNKDPYSQPVEILAYGISHETTNYDSFTFETELRILSDLATIDLLSLDTKRVQVVLEQLIKLKERFSVFWINFNGHYFKNTRPHTPGFIFQIGLHDLFLVRNLQPEYANILIEKIFVDDLKDSVRLRESVLAGFIKLVQKLVQAEGGRQQKPEVVLSQTSRKIANKPVFVDGIAGKYFEVIKAFFLFRTSHTYNHCCRRIWFPLLPCYSMETATNW